MPLSISKNMLFGAGLTDVHRWSQRAFGREGLGTFIIMHRTVISKLENEDFANALKQ